MTNNKKTIYILLIFLTVALVVYYVFRQQPKKENETIDTPNTELVQKEQAKENTDIEAVKIIPGTDLCAQISQEFVTKATGLEITRTGQNNDASITACNYYLTDESNSPYLVVVLNKNLSVDAQKAFYKKQKLELISDPRIITQHIIYMATKEDRIAHIDLILDPMNFIRVDKNVDRAIDNEGLIKLAVEISKRL